MFAKPVPGRTTAAVEGDTVVLLIGMRVNHFWAVTGSPRTYYVVQYWEPKDQLYAYANSPDMFHHKVWSIINRKERAGKLRGRFAKDRFAHRSSRARTSQVEQETA
jgi:fumigallin biosynthesis monooxygenase-like protein